MSSDSVTPPLPRFRINDLHHPDLLPLLSIPQFPPPVRASINEEGDARQGGASDGVPDPSALDAVIALLKKTDVSYLRPRQPPVESPPRPTPLMRAVAAKSRDVFIARHQDFSPQQQGHNKSPAPIDAGPKRTKSAGRDATPNATSDQAAKRRRTSELRLELATSIETQSKLAPTVAEEAAAASKSFISAVEGFMNHPDEPSIRFLLAATLKLPASTDINVLGGKSSGNKLSACLDSLRSIINRGKVVVNDSDEQATEFVGAALEASAVILHLATTSGGLFLAIPEETIESAIEAARFHLYHNFLTINKPDERHDEIANRVQALLDVTARLVANTKTPTALCLPPLRPCMLALTSPTAPASLQDKAGSLLAAVFSAHPELRGSLIRDFVQVVVLSTPYGKSSRREVPILNADIHIVSATLLTMIASCVDFPQEKSTNFDVIESVREAYAQAVAVADRFWSLILEKMGEARLMKSEMEVDIVAIIQFIVTDLLAATVGGSDYPAAGMVLQRLVASLLTSKSSETVQRGLDTVVDTTVRSAYVDLLGRILATHAANKANLELSLMKDQMSFDRSDARQAVLERLSWGGGSLTASWARRFLMMADLIEGLQPSPSSPSSPEDMATALMAARRMEEALSTRDLFRGENSDGNLQIQLRVLASGVLAEVAPPIVSWLVNEGLDQRTQAPTVRAKCVRALSEVVACDRPGDENDEKDDGGGQTDQLTLAALTAARRCLTDDSISVREAALALCGRAATSGQQESLVTLSEILLPALEDRGASVRKSAVKMLQDVMSRCTNSRAVDSAFNSAAYASAARALMPLAHDGEESVKTAVARAFASTWFTWPTLHPSSSLSSRKSDKELQKKQRFKKSRKEETTIPCGAGEAARRLAVVAASCCMSSENGVIAMPISDTTHPFIASLRLAAGVDQGGCQLAAALLEGAFTVSGTGADDDLDSDGNCGDKYEEGHHHHQNDRQREAYLLGLHALTLAVPECLAGNGDRVLAALGPRLGGVQMEEDNAVQRRRLLCMLSILEAHFMANGRIKGTETRKETERQVATDLVALVNGHRYTQVVAAACRCLGRAASSSPHASGPLLVHVTTLHHSWLLQRRTVLATTNADVGGDVRLIPRFLFVLGQLCRYGAEVLGMKGLQDCMDLFCLFYNLLKNIAEKGKEMDVRIRRCALEAVGNVATAKPSLLVSPGPKAVLESSLLPEAPHSLKLAALVALTDVLQADTQAEGSALVVQPTTPENGFANDTVTDTQTLQNKWKKKKKVLLARESESKLDPEAGIGKDGEDAGGVGGGVLLLHWDAILRLADDRHEDVAIRRRLVALMEVVLREGLVGPWTAVPCLVGLSADPIAADVASKSQKLLVRLAQRYPQYVNAANVVAGIQRCVSGSTQFQEGLGTNPGRALSRALGALYGILPWPSRPRRNEFLRLLVRRLLGDAIKEEMEHREKKSSCSRLQRKGGALDRAPQAPPPASLSGGVIVCLPLRRAEEVNVVLSEATSLCMRHADQVLSNSVASITEIENGEADGKGNSEAMRVLLLVCRFMKRAYGVDGRRATGAAVGNGSGNGGGMGMPAGTKKGGDEGAVLAPVDQSVVEETLQAILSGHGSGEKVAAMLDEIM